MSEIEGNFVINCRMKSNQKGYLCLKTNEGWENFVVAGWQTNTEIIIFFFPFSLQLTEKVLCRLKPFFPLELFDASTLLSVF